MQDTAGKIALGIIGVTTAAVGIFLATLSKVIVKIAVDYSDNLIWPVCVVQNKTSQHILIDKCQIVLDGVAWDWIGLVMLIEPKGEDYASPGWINPADYGIPYGLHRAYIKLRDQKDRIYKSNTVSFIVK